MHVLIRFSHGLGDCCQLTVVLQHLKKHRSDWVVDVRAGRGKHSIFKGLCRHAYHDQEPEPSGPYDKVLELGWWENFNSYHDKPNTKVTNSLVEDFDIPYDPECGRYHVEVGELARMRASRFLRSTGAKQVDGRFQIVLMHYEGNTSPVKKNLNHWQAQAIAQVAIRAGREVVVLDWDNRSALGGNHIHKPSVGKGDIWGEFGSGDGETIAAMISLCECFIGVDSGPGKIASSTDTPTLICWKGHHPIQFHDPAPNTWHLVPSHHRHIPPAADRPEISEYFDNNYLFVTYKGEHGLVAEAQRWLVSHLGCEGKESELTGVAFVCPNGIGDVMWVLTKIRTIAAGRPIDLVLSGDPRQELDQRCLPFLKRFPFVRTAAIMDIPILHDKEHPTDSRGRYRYLSDGILGQYHYLIPNTTLEAGRRLEEWLGLPVDWKVTDDFDWSNTERGTMLGKCFAPFIAFYLGPENGNVNEGHNRGFLWEPKHWVELGKKFTERGMQIVLVGAHYDRSYWERYVREGVGQENMLWHDTIGRLEIGETFAMLKEAKAFVSYQCGLGIVTHYLGIPTVMWWRPEGNSAHATQLVSLSEQMAYGWTNPALQDKYIGCIYQRQSVDDIIAEIDRREWLK